MRQLRGVAMSVAAVLMVGGCGSSERSQTIVDPPLVGAVTVTLTPSSVLASPGGSGSVGVTVTRSGSFSGAVQLTATGLPAGVTVAFGSSTVAAGAVSTSITVSVAASVVASPTVIPVTISGAGTAATTGTATLSVRTM